MKFFIVLSALAAVALAKPHVHLEHAHSLPVAHVQILPGAPIGHDGKVVDTPEVAHAKAAHESAHAHEKAALAQEAAKSHDEYSHEAHHETSYHAVPVVHHVAPVVHHAVPVVHHEVAYHAAAPVAHQQVAYHAAAPVAYTKVVPAAPLGHDGQVVDTAEVAHAKAVHAAAHAAEKAKSAHYPETHATHYYVASHESHY